MSVAVYGTLLSSLRFGVEIFGAVRNSLWLVSSFPGRLTSVSSGPPSSCRLKRVQVRWDSHRAEVGWRWNWLQLRIERLDEQIEEYSMLLDRARERNPPVQFDQDVEDAGCSRTRAYTGGQKRRRLMYGHSSSQPTFPTGPTNFITPLPKWDGNVIRARAALLDRNFHLVLSLLTDAPPYVLNRVREHRLKMVEQMRVLRNQPKGANMDFARLGSLEAAHAMQQARGKSSKSGRHSVSKRPQGGKGSGGGSKKTSLQGHMAHGTPKGRGSAAYRQLAETSPIGSIPMKIILRPQGATVTTPAPTQQYVPSTLPVHSLPSPVQVPAPRLPLQTQMPGRAAPSVSTVLSVPAVPLQPYIPQSLVGQSSLVQPMTTQSLPPLIQQPLQQMAKIPGTMPTPIAPISATAMSMSAMPKATAPLPQQTILPVYKPGPALQTFSTSQSS